jgi:hypothetical protein
MKPESDEEIESVAITAAGIYGQAWDQLPGHSKEKWKQTVQAVQPGGGTTKMEQAAGAALLSWGARRVEVKAETETKRKGKKGE